jgi:hypothetical protein
MVIFWLNLLVVCSHFYSLQIRAIVIYDEAESEAKVEESRIRAASSMLSPPSTAAKDVQSVVYNGAASEAGLEQSKVHAAPAAVAIASAGDYGTPIHPQGAHLGQSAPVMLQEGVFLWQLYRRATLLNDGFQRAVLTVIRNHEAAATLIPNRSDVARAGENTSSIIMTADTAQPQASNTPPRVSLPRQLPLADLGFYRRNSGSDAMSRTMPNSPSRFGSIFFHDVSAISGSLRLMCSEKETSFSPKDELMKSFLSSADARAGPGELQGTASAATASESANIGWEGLCCFKARGGTVPSTGLVEVVPAPIKSLARMQEKLHEYAGVGAHWPLAANILDPVRAAVVCAGALQVLEALNWFASPAAKAAGLEVCKVKNKFAQSAAEVQGGYRAVMVCLVYSDPESGLRIIGEVQVGACL